MRNNFSILGKEKEKVKKVILCGWNFDYTTHWKPRDVMMPLCRHCWHQCPMMTSSNRKKRVIGPLCGEFTSDCWISPHKGQWHGALMFSFICARINGWVNNGEAGDLRRHRAHYDVTVISSVDEVWSGLSIFQCMGIIRTLASASIRARVIVLSGNLIFTRHWWSYRCPDSLTVTEIMVTGVCLCKNSKFRVTSTSFFHNCSPLFHKHLLYNILCFDIDISSYQFVWSNQWGTIQKISVFEGRNRIKIISWEGWTRLFGSSVNINLNFDKGCMAIWLHLDTGCRCVCLCIFPCIQIA